jgi:hypothetical protein
MSDVTGIGWAVKQMWDGHVVRRRGWNGKGMYIALTLPSVRDDHLEMTVPFVFMKTATNDRVPWLCSQTDLLAIDWEIAKEIAT